MNDEETFYTRCGEILGIEHEYHVPYKRRTRWNARVLGNGRYPGFGTIQIFGSQIRVMCKKGTFMLDSYEEVYTFLADSLAAKTPA